MYLDASKFGGDMKNHEKAHLFARDIIRVKNPLAVDFKFKYDSIWNTVKANSTKDMERYLANRFCEVVAQHIIGQIIIEQGNKAVEKLSQTNGNLLIDKYLENRQVWDKLPRLDDRELNEKIWRDCWIGVVEKYGEDRDEVPQNLGTLGTSTPLYQQLADRFSNLRVGETLPESEPVSSMMTVPASNVQVVEPVETVSVSDRSSMEQEVTQLEG